MKILKKIMPQILLLIAMTTSCAVAQTSAMPMAAPVSNPWTDSELADPAALAKAINTRDATIPLVLNIGAVEDIRGAKHIGPVSKADNMEKLKTAVAALPKSTALIIYCGCCPFAKCPNIRPAFTELKKMGFTDIKVLNLPTNLHTNWIARGFPLEQK